MLYSSFNILYATDTGHSLSESYFRKNMRFLDAKITAPNTAAVINPIVAGNGNSGVGVGPLVEPPADVPA